jgi:hypothetical protein
MKEALIIGAAALGVWWLWKDHDCRNPDNVRPRTNMTGPGQASTVYGPGGVAEGAIRARLPDSAAAKAAAKAFAAKPVTSRLSLFRALMAQSAQTPPAPAPGHFPDPALIHQVRGTMAVTQIT